MSAYPPNGRTLGPATLRGAIVRLRPPRLADYAEWRRIRLRDRQFIEPFWLSSSLDWVQRHSGKLWVRECATSRIDAWTGRRLAMVIEVDGRFAGQIELGAIDTRAGSAEMGIWMDAEIARHGLGGLAAALILDHAFDTGLVRVTAPISPANTAAARGAAGLGYQREALMARYFHIGGARRDHELWGMTPTDRPPEGFTRSWLDRHERSGAPLDIPATGRAPRLGGLSPVTIGLAFARFLAGRMMHGLDPLRAAPRVRLYAPGSPRVLVRGRRLTDWRQWRRAGAELDPASVTAPGWSLFHWMGESARARPGLRARTGLVLAILVDGRFAGECRLFDLDMFDRNARLSAWCTDPDAQETALRLLLDYAFGPLALCRVALAVATEDAAAAELAARLGMRREGTMRGFLGDTGLRGDHDLWAVTDTDRA